METILIIVALSLLIFSHEAGHFFSAKLFRVRVDEFGIGFPPRLFGRKIGETLYSVNVLPFGGFVKIAGEDGEEQNEGEKKNDSSLTFSDVSVFKRILILSGGIFMNIVAGWILLSVVFMVGIPTHLAIGDVASGSPAFESGLAAGDIILSVSSGEDSLSDPITPDEFKNFVAGSGENEITVEILRGDDVISVVTHGRTNPPEGQGSLGVAISMTGVPKQGFFSALAEGARETVSFLGLIVKLFFDFISGIFSSPEMIKDVAGPVGIVMIARQASDLGFVFFIQLLALISLQLAVFNLIPIPALDGGRILFLLYEAIFRVPASKRLQTIVNAGGFVFLIALMIFVTFQDIGRFF